MSEFTQPSFSCIAIVSRDSIFCFFSPRLFLQRAGQVGAAGPYAARSAAAESRCAAEPASLRMACAREQLRKDGLATLSPALVSSPVV